jgi:hypothetical protein
VARRFQTGFAIGVLLATGCRSDPPHANTRPSPSGRSWTTPPPETSDGGLVAQRLPRVGYRGGRFIRNPRIVTVTFAKDDPAIVARLSTFGETITRSSWWRTVVDAYCVKGNDCIGEGTASHVRLAEPLAPSIRDTDVDAVLEREAKANAFGVLGPDTVLLVYLPKGVALGDASVPQYCNGGPRAFHRALDLGTTKLAYAVLPRCGDEAELTATASHELLETTTNPDPSERGFAFERRSDHLGFFAAGIEAVDPCGLITMDNHWIPESGFAVQRAWSNRAASLGHDPCVPARADRPYLALVPRQATVRLAKEGDSATIALDAVSDRAVPPWAVSAFDVSGYQDHTQYVELTLDKSTIAAGQTLNLTVVVRKASGREATVGLVSTLGVTSHMWPLAIVMR